MKRSEVIKNFLIKNTHFDLASAYNASMECQVLVAQDEGERIEGPAYTDDTEKWYSFRIPKNAATIPEDNDFNLNYNFEKHVLGIGMTGWCWSLKQSHWVCYDFDSIIGHSSKHTNKLTDTELFDLEQSVSEIPWITVRKSTSGSGRHLYVYVNKICTQNHTEHAALARAILGIMSGLTNFDFYSKVDVFGGNFWAWHRKMIGTDGLSVIKQGTILNDIPSNWQDHIDVISGKRKKSIPIFINENDLEDQFVSLTSQRARVPFDEDHKKLIKYLNDNSKYCSYNSDHHMLVTHTSALKEAHVALGLKGVFDTIATGTEEGDYNCFVNILPHGAWVVRRYSKNIQEASTWETDSNGWTKCFLNHLPDLRIAARIHNGIEHAKGGFVFANASDAQSAAAMIGTNLDLPEWSNNKKARLKPHKDGRLIVELEYDPQKDINHGGLKGFYPEGKTWTKVFETSCSDDSIEPSNYDDVVRHVISIKFDDAGWTIKTRNNWQNEPLNHIAKALKNLGNSAFEAEQILGSCVLNSWKLVNMPFQPEYPGNRQWNRNAAQLRYIPNPNRENLSFPTWNKLFDHLGTNLDDALINHKWCKANNIIKGSDYLKLWVASLLQHPEEPLPYLFLYGPEDCGKSSLQEALSLLISNGVQRADTALSIQSTFNAELENAILAVIEETDLRKNKNALNMIKDWLIAPTITIHRKGETPYDTLNYMHFIQTSNHSATCPIFPGDTRITMILINTLQEKIAKRELFRLLDKEASDFLAEMLNIEIPYNDDRLAIPIITTDVKIQAQSANKNEIELFIEEMCFNIDGEMIRFSEFYEKFQNWLDPNEVHNWSKIKVGRSIPAEFPYGRNFQDKSQFYIGNISFTKPENGVKKSKIICKNGRLASLAEIES